MVPMTFIWWIYHFWARFWPYFNFVDFRAFFGPFSLVNRDRQKMADLLRKMASNQKMQENKPTLKFNFTIENRWPVSKFSFWHSHWALVSIIRWTDQFITVSAWFASPCYILRNSLNIFSDLSHNFLQLLVALNNISLVPPALRDHLR